MRRFAVISALIAALAAGVIATSSSRGAGGPYGVTAIFDNAAFAVPGETVRIAGANVGSIKALNVCTAAQTCPATAPLNKAAVTIEIDDARFTPFYANATCAIRPQSLIGERYVDCEPGSSSAPELSRITGGAGAGTYYLPLTRTSSPVDSDLVQNIYQQPIRERFALILDELGTGLAARGSDLNAVIHRANPALGYTDQVIKILAQQNRQLAQLATDSDTVLAPLARAKHELSGFIVQANTTSVASAQRATDIARSFQLFPEFLRQLRPLMVDLGQLTDQGTPLLAELGQSAQALGRQFQNLTPFANVARPALVALGKSSQQSQPALVASEPLARQLKTLGEQALPSATLLDELTASLENTGAIEQLMSLLFNGANAGNGFDSLGHYVRTESLVLGDCVPYSTIPQPGCSARFTHGATSAAVVASSGGKASRVAIEATKMTSPDQQRTTAALTGLMRYLTGSGQ
ncbi:MAG: MCE family protein [Solirubrobacterales bacterium]|nr:MCE family protein [Solirubrobacterales bacterium]MBV9796597.1 MCE family protein [Solirubrobacterales bacterium]